MADLVAVGNLLMYRTGERQEHPWLQDLVNFGQWNGKSRLMKLLTI
jgi:hypothetical protein